MTLIRVITVESRSAVMTLVHYSLGGCCLSYFFGNEVQTGAKMWSIALKKCLTHYNLYNEIIKINAVKSLCLTFNMTGECVGLGSADLILNKDGRMLSAAGKLLTAYSLFNRTRLLKFRTTRIQARLTFPPQSTEAGRQNWCFGSSHTEQYSVRSLKPCLMR